MLPYVDPQCLKNSNEQIYKPNKKSDVYSVGILLWELTSGRPPFSNLDIHYQKYTLILDIIKGTREESVPDAPDKYVKLYKSKNPSILSICF
jgi:serine/threonine protein kinase